MKSLSPNRLKKIDKKIDTYINNYLNAISKVGCTELIQKELKDSLKSFIDNIVIIIKERENIEKE